MSTNHKFGRERRAKAESNRRPPVYQPNALPLGQAGSQWSEDFEHTHKPRRRHS